MDYYYRLHIPDISCQNCAYTIENYLKNVIISKTEDSKENEIIKKTFTNTFKKIVYVVSSKELDKDELSKHTQDIGFTCEKVTTLEAPHQIQIDKKKEYLNWAKGIITTLVGIALVILLALGIDLAPWIWYGISAFSFLAVIFTGWESYYNAYKELRYNKTFGMDLLFALSVTVAMGISIIALILPFTPFPTLNFPLLFDAVLLILGFRRLGKSIKEKADEKVAAISLFTDRVKNKKYKLVCKSKRNQKSKENVNVGNSPKILYPVNRKTNQNKINVNALLPDDIIEVQPGEIIPVDGECLSEQGLITNTITTGQVVPEAIVNGKFVCAGVIANTPLLIKVQNKAADSYLARLDLAMEFASLEKSPTQDTADRVLHYFVPVVCTLAIAVGVTIGFLFDPFLAIKTAISVLVAACPCVLGFIVPLSLNIGMNKAANQGSVFSSTSKLESAAQVDTMVLDINGTLTEGSPKVVSYNKIAKDLSDDFIFTCLHILENKSNHAIAKAICEFVKEQKEGKLETECIVKNMQNDCFGNSAEINGTVFSIGNERFMRDKGIDVNRYKFDQGINQIIFIARQQEIIGWLTLTDKLRNEAYSTIQTLRQNKQIKKIKICTGAPKEFALAIARQLRIPPEDVEAECRGNEKEGLAPKVEFIKKLQDEGHVVAMVGDGPNDAAAMAESNLGIAIQSVSADAVSISNADLTFQNRDLSSIPQALEIARQTKMSILLSLGFSLVYNLTAFVIMGGLPLFLFGFSLHPGIGAAIMVLQVVVILMNAYRFYCQSVSSSSHTHTANLQKTVSPSAFNPYHQPLLSERPTYDVSPGESRKQEEAAVISNKDVEKQPSSFLMRIWGIYQNRTDNLKRENLSQVTSQPNNNNFVNLSISQNLAASQSKK